MHVSIYKKIDLIIIHSTGALISYSPLTDATCTKNSSSITNLLSLPMNIKFDNVKIIKKLHFTDIMDYSQTQLATKTVVFTAEIVRQRDIFGFIIRDLLLLLLH